MQDTMSLIFEVLTWTTVTLVLVLACLLYKYCTRNFDYWKKRNVPYVRPVPFLGNLKDVATFQTSLIDWHRKIYENTDDEPFNGVFFFDEPHLMIKSPQVLRDIMIKDFDHFRDKAVYTPEHDVVQANLLFWQPSSLGWKTARAKVSPFFTSGKLKSMFPIMDKIGENLTEYVKEKCLGKIIDAKDLCSKYSTDVIAKCEFGIEANSFRYENAEIKEVGKRMFEFTIPAAIRQISYFYFQPLARIFRMSFYGVKNMKFLCNMIQSVIDEREKSGIKANDIVDLLVQLKKEKIPEFEGERIYSQSISIFIGGFETTGTTISLLFYELCLNKSIQHRLRQEILEKTRVHGITFETLRSMYYLEQCIRETLRKYPPVPFSDRMCIKDYKVPGTDFVIEKGTPIYVPMLGFHYDEKYFPDPEQFIPERFEDMSQINRNGMYYFPFGDGPRSCLGERFAMISVKLAVVHVLSEFEIERTEKTPDKMIFEKKCLLVQSKGGVPIQLILLEK